MADAADDLIAWERIRRSSEQGNALGALRTAAERRDADQERAVRLAADNLLDKALRRLDDEDAPAARRLVDRALRLSVDELQPEVDAALAVHLFVWDALRELALGRPDTVWLDRVESVTLDPVAHREWLSALRSLAAEKDLPAALVQRIRAFAGRTGEQMILTTVDHDARVDATVAILEALRGLRS